MERKGLRRALVNFGHVVHYCWAASRWATAIGFGVTALSVFVPMVITISQGLLVGSVPATIAQGWESPAGARSVQLLAVAAGAIAFMQVLYATSGVVLNWLGGRYALQARGSVVAALNAPRGISHLEDAEVADELAFLFAPERDWLWPLAPGMAASLVLNWTAGLGSLAILSAFHWWFPLIAVPAWIVDWRHGSKHAQANMLGVANASPAVRQAHYLRDMVTGPAAAKETRAFGLASWAVGRYADLWAEAMAPVWRENRRGLGILAAAAAAKAAAGLVMFSMLIRSALAGETSLAALAIFAPSILAVLALGYLGDTNIYLTQCCLLAGRARGLERQLLTMNAEEPERQNEPLPATPDAPEIRFQAVGFRYPGTDRVVLKDFTLCVPAGRTLAIVGDNGAGKTTLIKLLGRLYEPTSGAITVDGVPLRDLDIESWRTRLGVIFQDFVRWELPLRDNVGLGSVRHLSDPGLLDRSLARAGAEALIDELPAGWDTVLSRGYEGGADLSGGQWQKVALARALAAVEGGARVLVLDEPTASLDVRAEAAVFDRLMDTTRDVTTILISHRLSSVRRADRIAVIADGSVVEEGTHDELMDRGGHYSKMYRLQADRFVDEPPTTEVLADA